MKLTELVVGGLKGTERTFTFGENPIIMFRGENGTGKTTALQALHLLLTGKAPRAAGRSEATTGKDIMLLAAGDNLRIIGRWDNGVSVERKWTRQGKSVKEVLTQSINPSVKNNREAQGLLDMYFGRIQEVWEPSMFFELSSNKMRARLMTSVSSRPVGTVMDLMPNDIPEWAAPGSLDIPAETWVQFAIKETDSKIREEQAEIRTSQKQLDEMPMPGRTDDSGVKAKLADLREERAKIVRQQEAVSRVEVLRNKREFLLSQIAEMEMDIEAAHAEAQEMAETLLSLPEINEAVNTLQDKLKEIGRAEELEEQDTELREIIELAVESEATLKGFKAILKTVEQSLLASAKKPFEDTISSVIGKPTTVDLSDGGCRILVDGVDLSGLSDGETLRFIPGIAAGLAACSESKWVPLPIDRFESVSAKNRAEFLRGLQGLVKDGSVSQVFLASCQDTPEDADLCQVFDL